jgi:hypothetical protein
MGFNSPSVNGDRDFKPKRNNSCTKENTTWVWKVCSQYKSRSVLISKFCNLTKLCSDLIITASKSDGLESFVIEIGPDRITKLMEVFQGDFHHLANHLKLMNERMVLVNPKFQGMPPPA